MKKNALFMSVLSLLLCVSMLVGTTFAWFTDEVVSGNNVIAAGNLDIELEYYKDSKWNTVKGATDLFSTELWEPGHTQVVYLRLSNLGTLALKYQLGIHVASETPGVNVDGDPFNLSDHIEYGVVADINGETGAFADRAAARAAVTQGTKLSAGYFTSGEMLANAAPLYMALVVYMPESVGNVANYRGDAVPTINLGVNLQAAQKMQEKDSYGDDYDGGAYLPVVNTAEELASAIANGESVKLGQDITVTEKIVVPEGAKVVIDLGGNTIDAGYQAGSTEKHLYVIENRGKLTLVGDGEVNARGVSNYGDLTINGGTYNAIDTNGGGSVWVYAGKVTINGGTFNTADTTVAPGPTCVNVAAGASATINGGTFVGDANQTYAIISNGTLVINDADISADHGVISSNGATTINGGTFKQNGNLVATSHAVYVGGNTTTINGGTFKHNIGGKLDSGHVVTANGGDAVITGGTFTGGVAGVMSLYSSSSSITVNGGSFGTTPDVNGVTVNGTITQNATTGMFDVSLSNTDVKDMIADANGAPVSLPAGDFDMPGTSGNVTITGTKDTKIDLGKCGADNVTFEGVTVYSTGYYGGLIDNDTIVYNDCVIDGTIYLYGEKVIFNNCTFDLEDTNDYIWVYATKHAEFNNCTFNTMGKAILVFQDGSSVNQTVKVEGCTFNASAAAYNWDHTIHISAVSMDGSKGGTYDVILNNNTVDSDFNGLWQDKTNTGNIKVTVDGATVLAPNP